MSQILVVDDEKGIRSLCQEVLRRAGHDVTVAETGEEGLKHASAVNLDNVQTVLKTRLSRHVGQLGDAKMRAVCAALQIATGCDR